MSIEALKEKARRHEQKEEWQKALDLYEKAIDRLEGDDQPDIGLYNRAGDLQVRLGQIEGAVNHYESAVDLYVEAELPNNAIAVCKKVVRNLPQRHTIYLKMGQIRAMQGFLTDARQNFLVYAERMQAEDDLDEAFRALEEFADLAEDDHEIRMALAGQLEARERTEEAVGQLIEAYQILRRKGEDEEADAVRAHIGELDPDATIPEPSEEEPAAAPLGAGDLPGFETTAMDEPDVPDEVEAELGEISLDDGGGEEEAAAEVEEEAEEEAEPLPTMDFGDEVDFGDEADLEDEEEAEPLPMMEFGEDDGEEEAAAADDEPAELDAAAFGEADDGGRGSKEYVEPVAEVEEIEVELEGLDAEEEAEEAREGAFEEAAAGEVDEDPDELRSRGEALLAEGKDEEAVPVLERAHRGFAAAERVPEALETVDLLVERSPDDPALRQQAVEYAYRADDDETLVSAYLGLAGSLQRAGEDDRAVAVYQQVLSVDPENEEARAAVEAGGAAAGEPAGGPQVASSEDYVDLGSMILGDDETEKSTRFKVAYEEPTGDEAADFAKMLGQFKEKVSENLATDDVKAHHDLGTAYKEMGLLDEAISEFQQALRASATHLPTYELLGQCFLEMDQPEASVRSLERALDLDAAVEDEFLGIYYTLGQAHEKLGNTEEAREFYEKIFALDINFQDVTERLRDLRETA